MSVSKASINLDDIFGPPMTEQAYHEEEHEQAKSRSSTIQTNTSVASKKSHHSAIPPEAKSRSTTATSLPKSRASTVTSVAASEASKASTLKGQPANHMAVHSHAMVSPPTYNAYEQDGHSMDDQDLLATIFSSVALPEVTYNGGNYNHISDYRSETGSVRSERRSSHHSDRRSSHGHHQAIDSLDTFLAGEDEHNDQSTVVSSPRSHRSAIPSHHSSNHNNHYDQVPSVVGSQTSRATTATKTSVGNAPYRVAESIVRNSFEELELNGNHHQNAVPHIPAADYEEDYDSFEPAHLPSYAGSRAANSDHHRNRSMTMDSTVSYAESRYGGFDVHDDEGNYTAEEIDLQHDEVAYQRLKKKNVKGSPYPEKPEPISTGGTIKLRQLNQEVADAKQRQAHLTAQVERERAVVDQLRLQKQQSLAKEAAARAGRVSPASSPSGYSAPPRAPSARQSSIGSVVHNSNNDRPASVVSSRNTESVDNIYEEEPARVGEVAQHQKENGDVVARVGKISLIVPQFELIEGFSKNPRVNKVIVGGHAPSTEDDKTVLLFGPVGSGKTSAITSILNYLYDVKKENDFRFVLDLDIRKTTGLTAYVINNSILPFSVTIVDTPGVVDEKGNKTVSTLIKSWFEQELLDAGAFRLDAISIVLRHDEDSLGWPFIYELAAVKKMFGDDLKTNVLPIVTNSEVLPQPIAIRSLAQANISFVEYYKVNNSGFAAAPSPGVTKLQHNLFFSHGIASLESFFRDLQELIHPLLAVLRSGAGKKGNSSHSFDQTALY